MNPIPAETVASIWKKMAGISPAEGKAVKKTPPPRLAKQGERDGGL
ncbi:MAG: hypothetical protein AB1374_11425 [Bacillota bacterium]